MTAISRRVAVAIPIDTAKPAMSQSLAWSLEQVEHPHPEIGAPRAFPASQQAEARRIASLLAPACEPVSPQLLREWVRPIGAAVRNPPSGDDFAAWCSALMVAVANFASGAFTQHTQRVALQEFTFFPSVADVCNVVGLKSAELHRRRRALLAIADAETKIVEQRPSAPAAIPEWVGKRTTRHTEPASGAERASNARPPARSIEQQLAALKGGGA